MRKNPCLPDMILSNGRFYTLDPDTPRAEALAVKAGRIIAAGSKDDIQALAGPQTRKIDLDGRTVLPGMIDSHFHFYTWALGWNDLDLATATSLKDVLNRVSSVSGERPAGQWILGYGWNESDWPRHTMPCRDDLDAVAPDHPVALWRCDLHLVSVNSQALRLAGIDEQTPDPTDGVIERDGAGRATGILRELAPNLIKAVIPEPGGDEVVEWMQEGIAHLHTLGLTGVHDNRLMGGIEGPTALRDWQLLNERGKLDLRCWVGMPGERLDEIASLGLRTGMGDDRLRIGHLKYFADGGMGARTAWVLDPYLDAENGMPIGSMAELGRQIGKAEQAGLAVIVHAIGDRANREVITVFENLERSRAAEGAEPFAPPAVRHRIEHAQFIRSEDIRRLARMNMPVCVQPHNMILDINMIDECVGPLGRWTYPYREMIDAGVSVMMSSDAPVCSPSPLVGIHAAVTRQRGDGTPEGGWYPEHRISVEEAVRAYTTVPAAFYGRSNDLGSLSAGKFADLVVLDRDIFAVDPMEILETQVLMTVFDGRIVFRHPAFG
jgi:predicted amidohydrolase YtcJ